MDALTTLNTATLTEWTTCGNPTVEAAAKAELKRRTSEWVIENTRMRHDDSTFEMNNSGLRLVK